MKLTCSCGATIEARDNFAGAIDARKWSEDHAICRARATELLQADLAAARADYEAFVNSESTSAQQLRKDLAAARARNKECDLLLSRVLHELAGSASLCWEPKPTGVFATELALGFVEDAIKELRAALAGEKK